MVQEHIDKCRSDTECLKYASAVWINYCMNEGARKMSSKELGIEICIQTIEDHCYAITDKDECNLSKTYRALERAAYQ